MPRLIRPVFAAALVAVGGLLGCATPSGNETSSPALSSAGTSKTKAPAEYSVVKQIRYSYTLTNKTAKLLPKAQFSTYAPVPRTSHQWVERISASQPYRSSQDPLGNEILHFEFENVPPYGSKIVSITADLKMAPHATGADRGEIARFKQPERFIESDDINVVELARELRQSSPAESLKAAYDWVTTNLKSEIYIPEDRGAAYALSARSGDCTEFAYLLTALARANDVPARPVGGYVFKGNSIVKAVDYHNWTEFFGGDYWQIVDGQKKTFMRDQTDYVAMRIIAGGADSPLGDSHRYSYAGEGLAVLMN